VNNLIKIEPVFSRRKITEPVCFIIPPSTFLLNERVFISNGVLRVGSVLEAENIPIEVLDLSGIKNFLEVVTDYIKEKDYIRKFAVTSTTPQMPAVKLIVDRLREVRGKDIKIIIGGSHVTLVNAAYRKEVLRGISGRATKAMEQIKKMFDVIICGDGERAIFVALGDNPPKIIDADDKKSPLFLDNKALNELPLPARHLVDVSSYHYTIDGVPAISLIAQLGCPFGCGFCGGRESPSLRQIRTRTSDNIVAEMVHLYKTYNMRGFMFYDDELNVNKGIVELMKLITKAQKDLGVEWRLRGFIKSELFTEEQASAMYEAGFRWILVGFESGSPKILEIIGKKATQEENTRCVEIAKKYGLKVKALMSVGHPGESIKTVRETENWLLQVRPDDFDVTIITCYPGTAYYDNAVPCRGEKGMWVYICPKTKAKLSQIEVDYMVTADYFKGDPHGGYKSYVFTESLTQNDLITLRNSVESHVRESLGISFNPSVPAMLYEHSMGQSGFPTNILRVSK